MRPTACRITPSVFKQLRSFFEVAPACTYLHAGAHRSWSSSTCSAAAVPTSAGGDEQKALPLKSALKALFLKVHPDLWSEWPVEKAENQRSFQLLQEYLQKAKSGPGDSGPAARTPYRFRFYIKQQEAADCSSDDENSAGSASSGAGADGDEAGAAGGGGRHQRVELTLPPPEPSALGPDVVSPATKKALGKLLGRCGLSVDLSIETEEEAAMNQRLSVFLPSAAEAVRQAESGETGWDVRAANIRGAMRLARQVVVGFGSGGFSGRRQVELLEALARLLDELASEGADVAGAHVKFGSRTAMDDSGTLWLDADEDDPELWADFIGGADLAYAAARRSAAAALRRLEASVARAAGLGMVLAPGGLTGAPEYRSFLERLASHAATHGPIQLSSGGGGDNGGFLVQEVMGCIQVPLDAEPHQVYGFVQDRGAEALKLLVARRREAAREEDLSERVRRRLRLRRFSRDAAAVTSWQFESCCGRLLQHAAALAPHAEGLSVRVSDGNRVEGQAVDVAWDAEP